jgi:FlaA1/EpsC-like NDP-sugar epimerase
MELKVGAQLSFVVADVCDTVRVQGLLAEFRPEIIFHAAAYKHVPMMESNVQEAVKNNVMALLGLLDLAEEIGCKDFVLISSDKAVNPTNVMGATKRICELILSSRLATGMRCVSVRFGNVLGSSGSVIPVLNEQLRNHQPLTITHPEMSRFFMLIPEAVALVLQAFAIGNLVRLSGKCEEDVEIQFTGLREGEKLHEELFYRHENIGSTPCDKIKRTRGTLKDWSRLRRQLKELAELMTAERPLAIRAKLREIVPEYAFRAEDLMHEFPSAAIESRSSPVVGND